MTTLDIGYKLFILQPGEPEPVTFPLRRQLYNYVETAESDAMYWIEENPFDIVMLVELERSVCKHCGQPIQESAGWILSKWIHNDTGAHLCWTEFQQAEAKEE